MSKTCKFADGKTVEFTDGSTALDCVAVVQTFAELDAIRAEFTEEEQAQWSRAIPVELKALEKHAMRLMVVETGERVDGRAADEIRPVCRCTRLPCKHGTLTAQRGCHRQRRDGS